MKYLTYAAVLGLWSFTSLANEVIPPQPPGGIETSQVVAAVNRCLIAGRTDLSPIGYRIFRQFFVNTRFPAFADEASFSVDHSSGQVVGSGRITAIDLEGNTYVTRYVQLTLGDGSAQLEMSRPSGCLDCEGEFKGATRNGFPTPKFRIETENSYDAWGNVTHTRELARDIRIEYPAGLTPQRPEIEFYNGEIKIPATLNGMEYVACLQAEISHIATLGTQDDVPYLPGPSPVSDLHPDLQGVSQAVSYFSLGTGVRQNGLVDLNNGANLNGSFEILVRAEFSGFNVASAHGYEPGRSDRARLGSIAPIFILGLRTELGISPQDRFSTIQSWMVEVIPAGFRFRNTLPDGRVSDIEIGFLVLRFARNQPLGEDFSVETSLARAQASVTIPHDSVVSTSIAGYAEAGLMVDYYRFNPGLPVNVAPSQAYPSGPGIGLGLDVVEGIRIGPDFTLRLQPIHAETGIVGGLDRIMAAYGRLAVGLGFDVARDFRFMLTSGVEANGLPPFLFRTNVFAEAMVEWRPGHFGTSDPQR